MKRFVLCSFLAGLAACGSGDDVKWAAICVPKPTVDGVSCKITNNGKQAGRACITVRMNVPDRQMPVLARRTCTRVLEPKASVTIEPPLTEPATPCVKDGLWGCPIEILENSQTMGENISK